MRFPVNPLVPPLVEFLRGYAPGELITYQKLTQQVGLDVRNGAAPVLGRARAILQREGIRFDTIRGQGVQRLSDSEIARSGHASVKKVHRTASRELKRASTVAHYGELAEQDKVMLNTTIGLLGALKHFSNDKGYKMLQAATAIKLTQMSLEETSEVMKQSVLKMLK